MNIGSEARNYLGILSHLHGSGNFFQKIKMFQKIIAFHMSDHNRNFIWQMHDISTFLWVLILTELV